MILNISQKTKDILSYESDVWASADVLRSSVGLKNSEFPDFMMPFFALRMVESRLIRKFHEISQDTSLTSEEDFIDEIKDTVGFYNAVVIEQKKTLSDIVKNDKTFYSDFIDYLNGFDLELKNLLGIVNPDKTENLNITSVIESLRKKNALFGYVTAWANVDFTPYDNSEITTLEEHIKRKWADMSAETAGEQYTPDDVINLISELIVTDNFKEDYPYKLYDMTCGGGNMLYGIDDKVKSKNNQIKTETYGQELRGSLFALSKIESMFRKDSHIEQGNTLTNDKFSGKKFDYGVANPPYGVSWKEEQKTIEADQTQRFGHGGYPSVSDGQLLFVQHMLAKLNSTGKSFIVLNGSPLFSGDAGSGESNIRKWILDNDWLEALIQLPTNEFFNTGITTYIWCLNKNKPELRKDKILCINAEEQFVKLKKNKGNKSKEVSKEQAIKISEIYQNFIETEISKVKSKYDFYFNKQSLKKLEKDEKFGAFQQTISFSKNDDFLCSIIFNHIEYIVENSKNGQSLQKLEKNVLTKFSNLFVDDQEENETLIQEFNSIIKDNYEELTINLKYCNDKITIKNQCIFLDILNQEEKNSGLCKFNLVFKKENKKNNLPKVYIPVISIESNWTKDEEKIEYSPNEEENQSKIKLFMQKWVSENPSDYQLIGNQVGVEINFNSVFPKKIEIRSTTDILADIANIDKELGAI
jgi:type I restriction enzyme M protein